MQDVTRGTCQQMCPQTEIQFRIENSLVHVLECSRIGGKSQPDPHKMVKEFSRSAAGNNLLISEQLRPLPVLMECIAYLMELFLKEKDDNLEIVYNFVMDRLRSIRQDMVVQRLNAQDTIRIIEKMIPFYVESEYMCNTTENNFYNWKLHSTLLNTQMEDCISTWKCCLSQTMEFSQELLYISFFRNLSPSNVYFLLPYFTSENQRLALSLYNSYLSTNFVKFFRLFSQIFSPFIKQSFITLVHNLRIKAIFNISIAFKCRNSFISSSDFQKWLLFDSLEDTVLVLSEYFSIENSSVLIPSFSTPSDLSLRAISVLKKFDCLL